MSNDKSDQQGSVFVVTVDTEADNEWARGGSPTYDNIRGLPRFQELCDRYGVRPTYLVTYDVAGDRDSLVILRELSRNGNCEIGAHTHAWRTPPFHAPFDGEKSIHAYLYEYPVDVQARKLTMLTEHLENCFQTRIRSHRAGRWGIDGHCIALLEANGYEVDTSVAPLRSWIDKKGDPTGGGGPTFLAAPLRPYYVSTDNVERVGNSRILEVPVSVRILSPAFGIDWGRRLAGAFSGAGIGRRGMRGIFRRLGLAELITLNPTVNSATNMITLCRRLVENQEPVMNAAFHSSELLAGASPSVRNVVDEERVWHRLDQLFAYISDCSSVDKLALTEYGRLHRLSDSRNLSAE